MKERSIICSGESVRAILEDRKTMTRRVIKESVSLGHKIFNGDIKPHTPMINHKGIWLKPSEWSPHGIIGDRLWVKEAFGYYSSNPFFRSYNGDIIYKADNPVRLPNLCLIFQTPIFMPRWASRILLEITAIRAERLQEITYEDILAEGWNVKTSLPITDKTAGEDARLWYRDFWDSLNAKKGYGWDKNPWVWVIAFKVIK